MRQLDRRFGLSSQKSKLAELLGKLGIRDILPATTMFAANR